MMFNKALTLARQEDAVQAGHNYACAESVVWKHWAWRILLEMDEPAHTMWLVYTVLEVTLCLSLLAGIALASKSRAELASNQKEFAWQLPLGLAIFAFYAWLLASFDQMGELQDFRHIDVLQLLPFPLAGFFMITLWAITWLSAWTPLGRFLRTLIWPRYTVLLAGLLVIAAVANCTLREKIGALLFSCSPRLSQLYEQDKSYWYMILKTLPPTGSRTQKATDKCEELCQDAYSGLQLLAKCSYRDDPAAGTYVDFKFRVLHRN